jgi:hypothetical protein
VPIISVGCPTGSRRILPRPDSVRISPVPQTMRYSVAKVVPDRTASWIAALRAARSLGWQTCSRTPTLGVNVAGSRLWIR